MGGSKTGFGVRRALKTRKELRVRTSGRSSSREEKRNQKWAFFIFIFMFLSSSAIGGYGQC